jgi:mannose-1-phosphate guanylyltransferase
MRAMLFAAGLGTRLRPLTDERPKPAVPVALRPLASLALVHLAQAGAERVVVNTHHLGGALPGLLAPHAPAGLRLHYVHEETLLGTGGGLRHAEPTLLENARDDELVVVMNGDVIFAPDLARAVAHHRSLDAIATMVVRATPGSDGHGAVEIDAAAGLVRRLHRLPEVAPAGLLPVTFTGVHVLSRRAFEDLPTEGCIARKAYRRWIDAGERVGAVIDETPWRDLGTLREYLDGNLDLAAGTLSSPYVTPGAHGSLVAPDARVAASARVERCVIGAGSTVAADVQLTRVVVWDGVDVVRDACDTVITPRGVVRLAPGVLAESAASG